MEQTTLPQAEEKTPAYKDHIRGVLEAQRQLFRGGRTLSYHYRLNLLKRLKEAILEFQDEIHEALAKDLRKSIFESYVSETGFVLGEIEHAIKKLRKWMKPKRTSSLLVHFPARSYIYSEPFGSVLVIGPWNYPFQLVISPLVGALAAGNTAILKPSEVASHTADVIARMIEKHFDPAQLAVIQGGVPETQALLDEKFDYIFYTGNGHVGRIVMEKAAKHLTPVTLELGGKSPCMVFGDVDVALAAKRIVWGKFFNAGQTCVAPDYVLVEQRHKKPLVQEMKRQIEQFYGSEPKQSPDYPRIINQRHFDRLQALFTPEEVIAGGDLDRQDCYIAPTLLDSAGDKEVMKDEIFGPLLPIIEMPNFKEAVGFVKGRPKPLALYLFTKESGLQEELLRQVSAGGVCLNDTIVHLSSATLPFGGVGESGMGAYHGKHSFDLFSHKKSVMKRFFILENPLRYPPYKGKLGLIKKILSWLG